MRGAPVGNWSSGRGVWSGCVLLLLPRHSFPLLGSLGCELSFLCFAPDKSSPFIARGWRGRSSEFQGSSEFEAWPIRVFPCLRLQGLDKEWTDDQVSKNSIPEFWGTLRKVTFLFHLDFWETDWASPKWSCRKAGRAGEGRTMVPCSAPSTHTAWRHLCSWIFHFYSFKLVSFSCSPSSGRYKVKRQTPFDWTTFWLQFWQTTLCLGGLPLQ